MKLSRRAFLKGIAAVATAVTAVLPFPKVHEYVLEWQGKLYGAQAYDQSLTDEEIAILADPNKRWEIYRTPGS